MENVNVETNNAALNTAEVATAPVEVAAEVKLSGMDRLKSSLHMPRPTAVGALVGATAAASLELLSSNGSKVSAAAAFTVGGVIALSIHNTFGDPKKDPEMVAEGLKSTGMLFPAMAGTGTFLISAAVGRIAASYFPGDTKEEVAAEEDQPVSF